MNPEIKRSWIEALRSNAYNEIKSIKDSYPPLRDSNSYSVIGVLCDVIDNTKWLVEEWNPNKNIWHYRGFAFIAHRETLKDVGLTVQTENILISMTRDGLRFADLADFIEGNL